MTWSLATCQNCHFQQVDVGLVRGQAPKCLSCGNTLVTDGSTWPHRDFSKLTEEDLKKISMLVIELELAHG